MNKLLSGVSMIAVSAALCSFASAQELLPRRIDELVVTATKSERSTQDIPVAVQAFDGEALDNLNIQNFDDYIRYLPNVNAGGRGPGQSEIYIRGMSIDAITVLLAGAQGSTPNVALYLDEQPVTSPGRNLDVYVTDLERIEVLPGPQGTLFGASSQAGTVRLITNKPNLNEFQAGFDASIAFTKNGKLSHSEEGYINLPLIDDKLAIRGVFFNSEEGGYIDNVPGSFTPDPAINPTLPVGASYLSAENTALVKKDFNDSSYQGFRIGAKYAINYDWEFLAQHMHQKLEVDGVFDYDPAVGDLQVNRFFPDELEDTFDQTSWTLEGRLAMLDIVYTGAYLDRNVEQSVDYTGYNNVGGFIAYYTCTYTNLAYIVNYGIDPSVITPGGRECLDPVKGYNGQQDITRHTHEFRFSTPQDYRIRAVAGVFYDDVKIESQDDYIYQAAPDLGFAPNAPISTAISINPDTRPVGVTFFNDVTRTEKQLAFFGEVSFDIIPDTLTITGGARYYDLEIDFFGSSNFADGIFQGSVNTDRGRDYNSSFGHSDQPLKSDDVIFKANLSYTPTNDLLFYATYSEGFRPGGFNRGGGAPSFNPAFPMIPVTYETDNVTNYELGWKTTLLDGTFQFNGAAYYIKWTDMQVSRFDPVNVSILTFIDNAADSEIIGVEADFTWYASDSLTVLGAFSYNDTELTDTNSEVIELVPIGSELPLAPPLQANLRVRYDWQMGNYDLFAQGGIQYASRSFSSIVAADRRRQDSYTTIDMSVGVNREGWGAKLFVENLTDERADLFFNVQDDSPRITTNRPRTVGLRLSFDY